MKRRLWYLVVALLAISLAGCSQVQSQQPAGSENTEGGQAASAQSAGAAAANPGSDRQAPEVMKLALGIFALEKSETPIDREQAITLLTLWRAARALSDSDTTAEEEMRAVINQIQATYTPEQLSVLEAMDLGFDDMQTLAQEYGLELGGGGGMGAMSEEMRATIEAARASGTRPQGGFMGGPEGGGPPMGAMPGSGFGSGMAATAQASGALPAPTGLGLPAGLVDGVIEFLETRAQ